ncbi:FkbM family methyltransferase [Candidatus Roizmanbacteria bacterium]|nr:FkbM family methyltransferase [Candidatus Roizmanbacteria bacterium]
MLKELTNLLSKSKDYYFSLLNKKYGIFDFRKFVILFGAAKMAKVYIDLCKENKIRVTFLSDNNKTKAGKLLSGFRIISIEDLLKFSKKTQIIITSIYEEEIFIQLKSLGFSNVFTHAYFSSVYPEKFTNPYWQNSIAETIKNKEKIVKCFKLFKDKQSKKTLLELIRYRLFLERNFIKKIAEQQTKEYFDKKIIKLSGEEIFVDAGAYDGDTVKKFLKISKGKFAKIYAFEPDAWLFKKLRQSVEDFADKRIEVLRLGLGKKEERLRFTNDATLGSRIGEKGEIVIKVMPLDKILDERRVTFIKYDIEGSEYNALLGAKNIIRRYRPKLAICVYHMTADFWRIPLLIRKFNSEYRFYLRHYSHFLYGTVCYAV